MSTVFEWNAAFLVFRSNENMLWWAAVDFVKSYLFHQGKLGEGSSGPPGTAFNGTAVKLFWCLHVLSHGGVDDTILWGRQKTHDTSIFIFTSLTRIATPSEAWPETIYRLKDIVRPSVSSLQTNWWQQFVLSLLKGNNIMINDPNCAPHCRRKNSCALTTIEASQHWSRLSRNVVKVTFIWGSRREAKADKHTLCFIIRREQHLRYITNALAADVWREKPEWCWIRVHYRRWDTWMLRNDLERQRPHERKRIILSVEPHQ